MSYSIHRLPRRLTPEEEEMDIYDIAKQIKKKARGKKAAQDGDKFDDELDDELDGCEAADEPECKPVRLCQDGDTLWLKIDEDFDKTSRFHFNYLSWYSLLELAANYGWEPLRPPDHYCGNRWQVVNGEDTKNLVTALQRAYDDLARIIPTEPSWGPVGPTKLREDGRSPAPSEWQTEQVPEMRGEPDWESLSPEEFWTYGYNLETLKNFIDFALKADYGFRIS
jgi:hypothetical protein